MKSNEEEVFVGDLNEIETGDVKPDISLCEWGCTTDDV